MLKGLADAEVVLVNFKQGNIVIYKYIWLDGYAPEQHLRSKIQVAEQHGILGTNDQPPVWSFDGSSTKQATGGQSDCVLNPVGSYRAPSNKREFIGNQATLVMCEVLDSDNMPHESNTRRECQEFIGEEWWFGFEQEYFFYQDGEPLGWKKFTDQGKNPDPQGQYYCAVGSANVAGREISERHLKACLQAGIKLTGTNAEVALGQWEYQCLGQGTRAADDLWISRYLLCEIAEEYGVDIVLHPKPKFGDWNGSGMHTNFSNEEMRTEGSEALMEEICQKLGNRHEVGIAEYGSDNDKRLTGLHETQDIAIFSYGISDRGASIRIPIYTVQHDWNGYLEDRRPAASADPYRIIKHIVETVETSESYWMT